MKDSDIFVNTSRDFEFVSVQSYLKKIADKIREELVCGCVNRTDDPNKQHLDCLAGENAARIVEEYK